MPVVTYAGLNCRIARCLVPRRYRRTGFYEEKAVNVDGRRGITRSDDSANDDPVDSGKPTIVIALRATKWNLEDVITRLLSRKQEYFNVALNRVDIAHIDNDAFGSISIALDSMLPSFLAPAHHYNQYVDAVVLDVEWDDIKWSIPDEEWVSNVRRRAEYQTEAQAVFLSTKMALDRMVKVFYYFYPGFSRATTFGRFKGSRPSGFMAIAEGLRETDPLMAFVVSQYHRWIHSAVAPRDIITHYRDLGLVFNFDSTAQSLLPIHALPDSERDLKVDPDVEARNEYDIGHLHRFVDSWYSFFDHTTSELLRREPRQPRVHCAKSGVSE